LTDLTVIVPLVVALGLLAYVSYIASARQSAGQLLTIAKQTWLVILLLTFPYLGARALVWYELLQQLGIEVPWREMVVAFTSGEMTKSLPAGVYVQNILLGRLAHLRQHSVIRSTTATTAMLGLESFIALPVILVVGIPGAPWLRWTLLGVVFAWLVVLVLVWIAVRYRVHRIGSGTAAWRRRIVEAAREFLAAGADLLTWRTSKQLIPTAIYMLIYAVMLDAIIRAVGVNTISFVQVLGIYAAMVLAVILVPIPTEIGITEVTGLGALVAYGVPRATAAIIILSFRLLATGATILIAGTVLLIVRRQLRLNSMSTMVESETQP